MECLICERIALCKAGNNPYFVMELDTGYVVLGDHQRFFGYTLFLCKYHVSELYQLKHDVMMRYLEEMALVAEAVQCAFPCDKMNYELLGNGDAHVHWHLFPRRIDDMPIKGPVWWLSKEEMWNDADVPDLETLKMLTSQLKAQIIRLSNEKQPQQDAKIR